MKTVSIQELKANLSGYLDAAASGEAIVITKHRRPVARLVAAENRHLWVGSRVGRVRIRPVLDKPLPASAWKLIEEDREESAERPLLP